VSRGHGKTLASGSGIIFGSADHTVRLWDVDPERWIARA